MCRKGFRLNVYDVNSEPVRTLADLGAKTIPPPIAVTRGEALYALGDVVSRTKHPEEATPLLEESLRLEPQRGETYAALARVKSAGGEKRLAAFVGAGHAPMIHQMRELPVNRRPWRGGSSGTDEAACLAVHHAPPET